MLDPATGEWSALGVGVNGPVHSLTQRSSGELLVGGSFSSAGGVLADNIARWTGFNWYALGGQHFPLFTVAGPLAALPNGDIVESSLSLWTGSSWTSIGSAGGGGVKCMLTLPNGDLLVAGDFTSIDGQPIARIARWDGSSWTAVGSGGSFGTGPNARVSAMAIAANGDLLVGGWFTDVSGVPANRVARWDGSAWHAFGTGVSGGLGSVYCESIAVRPNGDVVVVGQFASAGGVAASNVATWNGVTWSAMGGGSLFAPGTLTVLPNGDVAVGWQYTSVVDSMSVAALARWDGSNWSPLSDGLPGAVRAATPLVGGGLAVAGDFSGVDIWDGASWSSIGSRVGGADTFALTEMPNGDIVAGGDGKWLGSAWGGVVSRWDGASWNDMGAGLGGNTFQQPQVLSLVSLPDGRCIAGGKSLIVGGVPGHNVAIWDPVLDTWSAMSVSQGALDDVRALVTLPNGDVIAGGDFLHQTSTPPVLDGLARWDGTQWVSMEQWVSIKVNALAVLPSGDLLIGGDFTQIGHYSSTVFANNIARWDGTTYYPVGAGVDGTVHSIDVLATGEVLVGGDFTMAGGLPADNVALWNGSVWSAVGQGASSTVNVVRTLDGGDVAIGGQFLTVDGEASPFLAWLSASAPASAAAFGVGCPSSGGANTLAADNLPIIGSTFSATGSGLPSPALVVVVTGFDTTNIPLAAVLPPSQAGCNLLVTPDLIDVAVSTSGSFQSQLPLPSSSGLCGLSFHQQFVPIEVTASLLFLDVTVSNGLTLTIGTF